jgi:hypothetical protein
MRRKARGRVRSKEVLQYARPYRGADTFSIFKISPDRVITYAVLPMNSTDVGWFNPLRMTAITDGTLVEEIDGFEGGSRVTGDAERYPGTADPP